jgi:site-specific DNA recombinase
MVGAVIYVRVSTKEQTENLSLPTQLRACEEYCRRKGYEILERFNEEGESAKTTARSQLQNLLKYCRTRKGKVHFVVVYNLTRFAREKYDHFALRAHLQSLGISLRSVTEPIDDTSTGKLMEGVLASFAQFDNDVRSDRTRAGMRAALELGRWTFPAPIGYLNAPKWSGKSLVPDPEWAPLISRAFEELATGRFTKQEVIARMTEAGLRTRRGLVLSPQSFGQMVRNSIYVGRVESPDYGVSTRGDFEPLIERGHVLSRSGCSRSPRRRGRSATAQSPGLPAARLRALRGVRPAAHRQLVEGPERPVRVLPLSASMPRGEREQGDSGKCVRRRVGPPAADARLHAAGQGSNPLRVGAA